MRLKMDEDFDPSEDEDEFMSDIQELDLDD